MHLRIATIIIHITNSRSGLWLRSVSGLTGQPGKGTGMTTRRTDIRYSILMLAMILGVTNPSHAVDGVLEINQACAVNTGCFAGDTAGFGVTIQNPGSYRLTSNLTAPLNTSAIDITASDVTLDLNGFTVAGGGTCTGTGSGLSCTASSGTGISGSGDRITVEDGIVRGFGSHGIEIGNHCRIANVTAMQNGGDGIKTAAYCNITSSNGSLNGGQGITTGSASTMERCIARSNFSDGIETNNGSTVHACASWDNGGDGYNIAFGVTVIGNTAYLNEGDGFDTRGGVLIKANVSYGNSGWQIRTQANSALTENLLRNIDPGLGFIAGGGFDGGGNSCNGSAC